MNHGFDFNAIKATEFCVCYDTKDAEVYWQIPVDAEVQGALGDMLRKTVEALDPGGVAMDAYEPAQKYSSEERLVASNGEPHMEKLRALHSLQNIQTNADVIRETQRLAFYFAVFRDALNRKIVAVRRATQFKGVVKARNRLISLVDDTLKLVADDVFKLDNDFDYLIFHDKTWILRPTGFEYTAALEEAIAAQASAITEELTKSVPCVDFSQLIEFVRGHRRAARLISSLRARSDLHLTSIKKLKKGCKANGIEFVTKGGKVFPKEGSEMAFLELLDRRRYTLELIDEQEEFYVAPNRRSVATHATSN